MRSWTCLAVLLLGAHSAIAANVPNAERPPMWLEGAGAERIKVLSVQGSEELARQYKYDVEVRFPTPSFKASVLLGHLVAVGIRQQNEVRYLSGYVSQVELETDEEGLSGTLTLVPWTSLLSHTAGFGLFQSMTAIDVVKKVCARHRFGTYEVALERKYPTRETATQYRETDLNFISRNLEDVGAYYFFRHEPKRNQLVIADSRKAHVPFRKDSTIPFITSGLGESTTTAISEWSWHESVQGNAYRLTDRDFKAPGSGIMTFTASVPRTGPEDLLIYDAPGFFTDRATGEWLTKLRLDEEQQDAIGVSGSTNTPFLATGTTFKLSKHPVVEQNGEYLVTKTQLSIKLSENAAKEDGEDATPPALTTVVQFEAIPVRQVYRPKRVTPVPVVEGPQTAVVVGPPGKDVYVDEFGRVRVHFIWGAEHTNADESSAWLRVVQPTTGAQPTTLNVPRVGQEVLVDFIEGVIDNPIVVGVLLGRAAAH